MLLKMTVRFIEFMKCQVYIMVFYRLASLITSGLGQNLLLKNGHQNHMKVA